MHIIITLGAILSFAPFIVLLFVGSSGGWKPACFVLCLASPFSVFFLGVPGLLVWVLAWACSIAAIITAAREREVERERVRALVASAPAYDPDEDDQEDDDDTRLEEGTFEKRRKPPPRLAQTEERIRLRPAAIDGEGAGGTTWDWLKPRKIVETSVRDGLAGDAIVRIKETTTRVGRGPIPKFPNSVVAVDVETTGLHSDDHIVSLGAIWLPTAPLAEGCLNPSFIHLIFDPGKKSHTKAEEVHGFSDWLLRHQEPFLNYAERVREFLQLGDVIIAHNADFDLGFINRELVAAGQPAVDKPVCCTMEGYRALDSGGSASLESVCFEMGLERAGKLHGALEDAWLALMAYLWLHEYPHCQPFSAIGRSCDPFNFRVPPPQPQGALPRRSKRLRGPPTRLENMVQG